ncbi:MAG TPA: VWA domain-containing protein [Candidatus Limnocylindrales bacterium]|nr:VWA domain-containing protein [Candidatus Limnocylindrales bacterium]
MTLLWPPLLVLLALVPLLVGVYAWRLRRRRPAAIRYSSLLLVRDAVPRSSRLRRHLPFALFVAAVASLVLALARPAAIVAVPTSQATIVLALDVSGSMCSSDIPPTRLAAAEDAAASFVQNQPSSTQIGIVAFGGFAELVQPPTRDRELLLDAIRSLTTGRRTAIGSGILGAIDAISEVDPAVPKSQADPSLSGPPAVAPGAYVPDIVVLLTDGASNTGPEPVDAAQQAKDRGIRVYTIGFGTADGGAFSAECAPQLVGREPFGGPGGGGFGGGGFGGGRGGFGGGFRRGIDEDTLKQVADLTGGKYYPAESASELQDVFANLPTYLVTKHEVTELSVVFVALGAALAAGAILLGQAWRPLP